MNEIKLLNFKDIGHGILLSDLDEEILNKFEIDYKNCISLKELLFKIEDYLNYNYNEELENLSIRLSEFDYYHNTNK